MIDAFTPSATAASTLQDLIWPEQGVCTERDLYMHLVGRAWYSDDDRSLRFGQGGLVRFDTYFNLFNIGKWLYHCDLEDLRLRLRGQGRFELIVFQTFAERSWERLINRVITLSEDEDAVFDLGHFETGLTRSLIFFELRALDEEPARLLRARWETRQAPKRLPKLRLSITTFRREAAVRRSVERFRAHFETSPFRDHIQLQVVDNGQSAEIAASDLVESIDNENLGGAGGFTRGLLEARAAGESHVLFMDDDASVHMESIERTWTFLAHATDPATAVAGAMIHGKHRWALWENGAIFDGRCIPQHMGTDLRSPEPVCAMEYDTTRRRPDKFYGGWWFFAFPLEAVTHLPFPFFVRGDDVSFSLVHDFNIVTLPGVVSFQDSFTEKESPLTWYLDLRSHLVHHLSLEQMDIGMARTLKIAVWFFLRNFIRLHYDSMKAVNLALEDVMAGPEFFAENADMAERRGTIKAVTTQENWQEGAPPERPDAWRFDPHSRWHRAFLKLTLNGHLLPFFRQIGNRITLPAEARGDVRVCWGAARITYVNTAGNTYYEVAHSKRDGLREGWRFARNAWRFATGYDELKAAWRGGYDELTTGSFWARRLGLRDTPRAAE